MNETDWLSCTDPQVMLSFLRQQGRLTERKARLFAVACCRSVAHLLRLEAYWKGLDLIERYIDQPPHRSRFKAANTKLWKARQGYSLSRLEDAAATAVNHCFQVGWDEFAAWAAGNVSDGLAMERYWHGKDGEPDYEMVRASARDSILPAQAGLLRDVFGNPFRPPPQLGPSVLQWNESLIKRLAEQAYQQRQLPSGQLDNARLAVLADALEEAGVTNQDIQCHLRQQGAVHLRGCHIVDALLQKT